MINNIQTLHEQKVKYLADKYVSEGFNVLIKPKTDELPFDLDNYQPDIIATKNNSGLIIEVRTSLSRVSVERLQALAEEVNIHPGWHFLLVTLEDIEAKSLPGTTEQLPSWEQLTNRFAQAHKLIENNETEPAFLFLWIIFEGALRKRAVDASIPIDRFPFIGLLKHMYSLGELTISQFDLAQACFEIRNRLAHGYIEKLSLQVLHNFDNLLVELLTEWINENKIKELVTILRNRSVQDYQIIQEIFASELVNEDKEKTDRILLNIEKRLEKEEHRNMFNDLRRLMYESIESSVELAQHQLTNQVILVKKAQIALDVLESQEQETIIQAINSLEKFPDGSEIEIAKLSSMPNYFIAKQGKYRIIFEFKPEQITIVDIVNYDRLKILYNFLQEANT